jgi:hypothetical protein
LREYAKRIGLPTSAQWRNFLAQFGLPPLESLPDNHPLALTARYMRTVRDREFERELEASWQEVKPKDRRRDGGAKPKFTPELIKEAQADLKAWGKSLRPYAPALKHVAKFLQSKGIAADKRQSKSIVRWIIVPLLPEDKKPKKRQGQKPKIIS